MVCEVFVFLFSKIVVSLKERENNELLKPQRLDRPNEETAHIYPSCVCVSVCLFSKIVVSLKECDENELFKPQLFGPAE